jgi:hypothetical protein
MIGLLPSIATAQTNIHDNNGTFDGQLLAKYWGSAPVFDVSRYAGVDWCAKVLAVYSDAAFIAASRAILDARGLTGSQTCASGGPTILSPSIPVHYIFGQMTLSLPTAGVSYLQVNSTFPSAAAPSAPTLSTATTGGSLAAATTYGVKITLVNLTGETLPSTEATKLTGAGATNSITVPTPTVGAGSTVQCYNVYSATPVGSGWKRNNTTGCVPLGTNYVIQTVGAGVVPPTAGTASEGMTEIEGQGDSTIISEDSTNSPFMIFGTSNVYIHGIKFVSTQTTNNSGTLWVQNANDVVVDHITCTGGGHCVFISGTANRINITNIHFGNPTIGGVSAVSVFNATNIRVSGVSMTNSTWPVSSGFPAAVYMNGCADCQIENISCTNNDMSTSPNGSCVVAAGSSYTTATSSSNTNINNVVCDGNISENCIDIVNFSHDINVSNVACRNANNILGVGSNAAQTDCVDIFMAARVTLNNINAQHRGGASIGTCCPSLEVYASTDVKISNSEFSDDQGNAGININGSPNLNFSNVTASRNWNTGLIIGDSGPTTINCNNTTTVTYVTGQQFGPWNVNTPVNIGAALTQYHIVSVTDYHTLILDAVCNQGSAQSFTVYTQDVSLSNFKADDNGQAGTGAGSRTGQAEGIYLSGHSVASINGGSANDNTSVAANKHQQYGLRAENTARARVVGFDMSGNGGGSICLLEGSNVSGNHTYCDSPKTSAFLLDDGVGQTWSNSGTQRVTANVSNSTTTMANATGLSWPIAASHNYYLSCSLIYQSASTSGGLKLAFTGPASPTQVEYCLNNGTSATASANSCTAAANTSFGTVVGSTVVGLATTNLPANFFGTIENGANAGTLQLQFASVASVSTTIERGSVCTLTSQN